MVKNPPASAGEAGDMGSIPESGRSLEKEVATHSSILAWITLYTEVPGGLQRVAHLAGWGGGGRKESDELSTCTLIHTHGGKKFYIPRKAWSFFTRIPQSPAQG